MALDNRGQLSHAFCSYFKSLSLRGHPRTTTKLITKHAKLRTTADMQNLGSRSRGQTADKAFIQKTHFRMVRPRSATLWKEIYHVFSYWKKRRISMPKNGRDILLKINKNSFYVGLLAVSLLIFEFTKEFYPKNTGVFDLQILCGDVSQICSMGTEM